MTPERMEKLVLARCRLVATKYSVKLRTVTMGLAIRDGKFVVDEPKKGVCALGACVLGSLSFDAGDLDADGSNWAWVDEAFEIEPEDSADFAIGFDQGRRRRADKFEGPYFDAGVRVRQALVREGLMK